MDPSTKLGTLYKERSKYLTSKSDFDDLIHSKTGTAFLNKITLTSNIHVSFKRVSICYYNYFNTLNRNYNCLFMCSNIIFCVSVQLK